MQPRPPESTPPPEPAGEYVRVYLSIRADERFAAIYGDDHHFATFVRLLMESDALWPALAPVPRSIHEPSLEALVQAGLIELMPLDHYRVHGLDAERGRRSEAGRIGGLASGVARAQRTTVERPLNTTVERPLNGPLNEIEHAEPSRATQSRATPRTRGPAPAPSPAPAREGNPDDRALEAYQRFVTYPSHTALKWLDDLVGRYGDEAVARAVGEAGGKGANGELLQRTKGILALSTRNAEKSERAGKATRVAEKAKPNPLLEEIKAAIVARYGPEEIHGPDPDDEGLDDAYLATIKGGLAAERESSDPDVSGDAS